MLFSGTEPLQISEPLNPNNSCNPPIAAFRKKVEGIDSCNVWRIDAVSGASLILSTPVWAS